MNMTAHRSSSHYTRPTSLVLYAPCWTMVHHVELWYTWET